MRIFLRIQKKCRLFSTIFLGAGIILSSINILSCTQKRSAPQSLLRIALDSPPKNIHPHYAFDLNSQLVDELLFESLIILDESHSPTCTHLCKSFEFKDPTTLVFELSKNLVLGKLRFSDNTPITAQDIKASIEILKHPKSPFKGAFEVIQAIRFHAPNKLELELSHAKPSILVDLFLAKILKQTQARFPALDIQKMLSSGPYQLSELTNNRVLLKPNPYYPKSGKLKPLDLFYIRDDQTRVFKFIKHEVDVIFNAVPLHSIKEIQSKYHAKILTQPGINITYLGINQTHPILKDPMVKRLIYESLNLDELLTYKLHGFASAHFSLLPIGSPFINKQDIRAQAKQKLSQTQKELLRHKIANHTFAIKSSNSPTAISMVHAIKAQLNQAGFQIKHQPQDFGTFMDDLKSGNFDIYYARFVGITDPSVFFDFFHSEFIPPKGRNRVRYMDTTWDRLAQKLSTETDLKKRIAISRRLQARFSEQLPLIPLWVMQNIVVLQPEYKLAKISSRQSLRDMMNLR